jgi:hypothetical protein
MKNGEVDVSGTLSEVLKNRELGLALGKDMEMMEEDSKASSPKTVTGTGKNETGSGSKIVDDEMMSKGSVNLSVYRAYFFACGGIIVQF